MTLHTDIYISDHVPNVEETTISDFDFTLLAEKKSPQYIKGRKTEAEYLDPSDSTTVWVKKTFTDSLDVNDVLIGIDIQIDWYNSDDTIAFTKNVFKPLNLAEAEEIKRKRRIRAMQYLKANAAGTPVEPAVTAIYIHYEDDIASWYELGGDSLGDTVSGETDSTINGYLDIALDPADNPDVANITTYDVRAAILYQIDYPYNLW